MALQAEEDLLARKREADDQVFKYVGVAGTDKPRIVEVGYNARILREMNEEIGLPRLVAELANGSFGYIPNRSAYAEGNYEVVSARCAEGSGEMLVTAAIRMLAELAPAADQAGRPRKIIEPPH